jgi:hypothetical protein
MSGTRTYFYARWGPPDDYAEGTRLNWRDSGPLLASDPALIDGGWPGLPLGIWRVDDVVVDNGRFDRVYGHAFTIAERLPSWRWLGPRGDEMLAVIEGAVQGLAEGEPLGMPTPVDVPVTFPSGHPDGLASAPRAHAAAHFAWLLRQHLLAEARRLDPGVIGVWEDFGCAGPIHEEFLTGSWALAERIAIDEAQTILAGS